MNLCTCSVNMDEKRQITCQLIYVPYKGLRLIFQLIQSLLLYYVKRNNNFPHLFERQIKLLEL